MENTLKGSGQGTLAKPKLVFDKGTLNVDHVSGQGTLNVDHVGGQGTLNVDHVGGQGTDRKFYIIDFLNIFSDFREIKYKKENIDFHSIKHCNKEQDTYDFFELFFTKYIEHVKIKKSSKFIFIMKMLNNYENVLDNIMMKHCNFDIKFIIIEDQYKDIVLDKNKDDFLCQYFFYILKQKNDCVLISNDLYRDKINYIRLFNFDISIRVFDINMKTKIVEKSYMKIQLSSLSKVINRNMIDQKYIRCTIPKRKLGCIL